MTSSDSSLTSTSHTMTACPPPNSFSPPESVLGSTLCDILAPHNRHLFITPNSLFYNLSLDLAKNVLDKSAGNLVRSQEESLKESRKRKRRKNVEPEDTSEQILKIKNIHTQGFEIESIWEQARRVIHALREDVEKNLGNIIPEAEDKDHEKLKIKRDRSKCNKVELKLENFHDEQEEKCNTPELTSQSEVEENKVSDGKISNNAQHSEPSIDNLKEYEDSSDDEIFGVYQQDPFGLNDGFFSIDEFNKQTEFMELRDIAEDQVTAEANEDEEIDWDANPLAENSMAVSSSRRAAAMEADDEEEDEDEEDETDENGPTFENMDLDALSGESDQEDNFMGEQSFDSNRDNTNDIMYGDFFLPPPRKASKGERQDKYLERQENKSKIISGPIGEEPDLERTIAEVRKDLFEEESNHDESGDDHASDLKSVRSKHERKQAKVMEEIRRLEAASIASKEWTLTGEARATDRPLNSLLETDLEFDRSGKPVPEVTAEVSDSIEDLIKRRILAQEFDEVIRRCPTDLNKTGNTRRGIFELDDTKAHKSLAEIYEEEYVKVNNPDTYICKADEKLQKEEKEIEALWKELSAKLDSLSNWHYKPKPPTPSLTIVSDVAAITMEDAQPTTASAINGSESMLAPQEIYTPGSNKKKTGIQNNEIVLRSGVQIAREEMTREQKIRRRRREKERISKSGGGRGDHKSSEKNKSSSSKGQRQQQQIITRVTLNDLKKGGVKIIGKKGDIRDVKGDKIDTNSILATGNTLKL